MLGKTFLMKRSATLVLLAFGVLLGTAWAQTESVLYSFCAELNCTDGAGPVAGVVFDQNGNLYGTTEWGGNNGCYPTSCGVVFKLTPEGHETVLYSFCAQADCADGAQPAAGVIFDQDGNLYGTTLYGGTHGNGVIFKLTPGGQETVLHSFCAWNGCADGGVPYAGLVLDQKGNLYGTTLRGGAHNSALCESYGCGVVFKLTPEGKYRVLYSFCAQANCADGAQPLAGVVFDQEGHLYGTTSWGGAHVYGTVFTLGPNSKETVLYSFCTENNCADGQTPSAGLVLDQNGNLYGTTTTGGYSGGFGTVFKLTPNGNETVLYSFCVQSYCPDGDVPSAALVLDRKGNLYGTASGGGGYNINCALGCGVSFKLTPQGKETVLHSFCAQTNCTDGAEPKAGLASDHHGHLYGTTVYGGRGAGVVFKLAP